MAAILKAAVAKGTYDLVLCGAQADDGAGQVGGMLAALLDWPYASLVNLIEVKDGVLRIAARSRRQPGNQRDQHALRALHPDRHQRAALRGHPRHPQGGLGGDPRHERGGPRLDAAGLGPAGARVKRLDYFVPPAGVGAEMLQGSTAEIAAQLIDLLKAKGGLSNGRTGFRFHPSQGRQGG